ncbi:MAG: hypothetical protein R6T93_08635 [Trueperaceae bacterium]
MIRTAPEPQRTIIGTFLVLAAIVAAVAPMSVALRSAAVVLFSYLAFAVGGMPFAYLAALAAPALGLLAGDVAWMIMLPVVLSGNLLAMLGLEYAWRWAALIVSPVLLVVPAVFVQTMARRELFRVELPWDDGRGAWVGLHLLVAAFGVLIALLVDRQRTRADARAEPGRDRGETRRTTVAPAADRGRGAVERTPTDPAASGRARAR